MTAQMLLKEMNRHNADFNELRRRALENHDTVIESIMAADKKTLKRMVRVLKRSLK